MSKKLAAGADGIVLDVKVGRGAFMSTVEEARELAQMMVNIGTDAGKRMVALLSDMDQPLGKAAGLALEVKEAIEVLHNGGPADFREHCLVAAAHMLRLAGKGNMKETRALAELALIDRSAFAKFREMVGAQGGNVKQVDEINLLPTAQMVDEIAAPKRGFVAQVDALAVGQAVLELGGGRLTKTDPVDHAVGVLTHVKVGDAVTEGQPIFTIHSNNMAKMEAARQRLLTGLSISEEPVARLPLFYDVIEG